MVVEFQLDDQGLVYSLGQLNKNQMCYLCELLGFCPEWCLTAVLTLTQQVC